MSYILDALRKADAQRERDPARGIHAQPVAPGAHATRARPGRTLGWAAGGAAILVVGGWLMWPQAPAPQVSPSQVSALPATPQAPVVAAITPPVVAVQPAQIIEPAPAPMPVVAKPSPSAAPAVAKARPAQEAGSKAAPKSADSSAREKQLSGGTVGAAQAAASAPAAVATTATGATSTERVLGISELPAEVQRALPKLAITGGVHSDNPAQRMLIVGGQVVGEGTELAPGVKLEEIRAKTAVIRFRGYRYSVGY